MTDGRTFSILYQDSCGCCVSHAAADFPGDAPCYTVMRCEKHKSEQTQTTWMVFDFNGKPYTVGKTEFEAWYNAEHKALSNRTSLENDGFSCRQVEITYDVVRCENHKAKEPQTMWAVFTPNDEIVAVGMDSNHAWDNASELAQTNLQNMEGLEECHCRQVEVRGC